VVLVTLPVGGIIQLDPSQFSFDPTTSLLQAQDTGIENQIITSIPSRPAIIDVAYFVPSGLPG
jgi:hypothetical protein